MTSRIARLALGVLFMVTACGDNTVEEILADGVYTLDLTNYDPGENPPSLRIANETLLMPLRTGAQHASLSRSTPGDLRVLYTRVGCWLLNPQSSIDGRMPLPRQNSARLANLAIEQERDATNVFTLQTLADETCFSYRTLDGNWHDLQKPTHVMKMEETNRVNVELALPDVEADAFAILLPTWTNVRQVSYTIHGP